MGIRMSVARCCCGEAGCTNVFCLYDNFSNYGNGNTVIGQPTSETTQWQQAYNAGAFNAIPANAIENASGQLEISPSATSSPDWRYAHGIKRRWGVTDANDFVSGYSNATWFEFDLVNIGFQSGSQLEFYAGLLYQGGITFRPAFKFYSDYFNNTTRYLVDFLYLDRFSARTLRLATGGFGEGASHLHDTYKLEMYDGAYDVDFFTGRKTFRWEWKVWVGGSVAAESINSTTGNRTYNKMTYDNTDLWCENSGIAFFNTIIGTQHPIITLDNVRMHVNNNTSCVP